VNDTRMSAVRLQSQFVMKYGTTTTKIVTLDTDELDGLVKSMLVMESQVFNQVKDQYSEVTFRSRSGFVAGAFFDFKSKGWKPFIQMSRMSDYTVYMSQDEFKTLRLLIEEAKKKL